MQEDNLNDFEDIKGLDYQQDENMTSEEDDIITYINNRRERMQTKR